MTCAGTSVVDSPPSAQGGAGVLVAIGAVVTVGTLPVFLVGGLAVQIRAEFGLPVSMLGLAGSLFFAISALAARPLVAVTERIGPTAALRLAAAGLAVRLAVGALADRVQPDLLRMVATMLGLGTVGYLLLDLGQPVTFLVGIVLGFGAGWAWPGVFNYAVAARFPDRVASATSVTQTGVYLGAGCGPLLFGLVAEHLGVAAAWLASGALAAAATVTLIVVRARGR